MASNKKFIDEMNKAIDYVPLVREIHDRVAIQQYNKGIDDCIELFKDISVLVGMGNVIISRVCEKMEQLKRKKGNK